MRYCPRGKSTCCGPIETPPIIAAVLQLDRAYCCSIPRSRRFICNLSHHAYLYFGAHNLPSWQKGTRPEIENYLIFIATNTTRLFHYQLPRATTMHPINDTTTKSAGGGGTNFQNHANNAQQCMPGLFWGISAWLAWEIAAAKPKYNNNLLPEAQTSPHRSNPLRGW